MTFHEVRFPASLSFGALGGPERRTDIVTLANGFEERNTPWAHGRRRYDAGMGLRSLDDVARLIAFFEARQGQLIGFRWKDWADYRSCLPSEEIDADNQLIALGDEQATAFQLIKTYRSGDASYHRPITKPVARTLRVSLGGDPVEEGVAYVVDTTTGVLTFADPPDARAEIRAGFEFDVPVRFDTDTILTSMSRFQAGEVPDVPVLEDPVMSVADLHDHLAGGVTHTCTCWSVIRRDGVSFGFTDHDRPLTFEGQTFRPEGGMTARALASSVGLSVNNTAALGVLSSDAIRESDILAGRYDGAEVVTWRVRWDDVEARAILFRGTMGEITRGAGGFEAELHGLTDALNQPQGRSYLTTCSAILGDASCGVDLNAPEFSFEYVLPAEHSGQVLHLQAPSAAPFSPGWFVHGVCAVLTGQSSGALAMIKADQPNDQGRQLTLWSEFSQPLKSGTRLRFAAGCDKRAATCVAKFSNLVNFQGFPDIPGEDWLISAPRADQANTGGSRKR